LTAFASASAIVLAHTEIDDKSNEIPAAQQMIRELGLIGVVFTADAMHRRKKPRVAPDPQPPQTSQPISKCDSPGLGCPRGNSWLIVPFRAYPG
jgi:hypothetical protein